MPLTAAMVEALAARCAPAVAPATLVALAHAESRFDPLVIGVNGPAPQRLVSSTVEKAEALAIHLIKAGRNIDLGLVQINSANLGRLGLSVREAFDPCRNLRGGATVLQAGYSRAAPEAVGAQAALRVALSYYNTGRPDRGFRNGYVARVAGWARPAEVPAQLSAPPPPAPAPPPWDVFARPQARSVFVITSTGGATS